MEVAGPVYFKLRSASNIQIPEVPHVAINKYQRKSNYLKPLSIKNKWQTSEAARIISFRLYDPCTLGSLRNAWMITSHQHSKVFYYELTGV